MAVMVIRGILLNPINGGGNLTLSIPEISFSSAEYTANKGDGIVYICVS